MADIDFLKRQYYVSALGLTEAQAARMTINDLEYAFFSTTLPSINGTGSPEGVIAAPVGSYYTDTAITNGALQWAKKTGTGNTGWTVVNGDTGPRNVTSLLLASEWTAPHVYLRRINDTVQISTGAITAVSGAADPRHVLDMPVGFRSQATSGHNPVGMGRNNTAGGLVLMRALSFAPYAIRHADTFTGTPAFEWQVTLTTGDAWPATLPGVAI